MMFHEYSYIGRIALLICLLITSLSLFFLEYRLIIGRRKRFYKVINALISAIIFILYCKLLENHIPPLNTDKWKPVHLPLPVVFLWIITIFAGIYVIIFLKSDYEAERKTISRRSIKQALDEIPAGIAFFREDGTLTLYNHKMLELSEILSGKALINLNELRQMLDTNEELKETEDIYRFPDGSAWRYEEADLITGDGMCYKRVSFFDVTELLRLKEELEEQTEALKRMQEEIKKLSENSRKLAKEEETLAIKTAWHDVMGEGLTAIRRLMTEGENDKTAEEVILKWKKTVASIRRDNDASIFRQGDMEDLYMDAQAVGIKLTTQGEPPEAGDIYETFILAIRTCLLNAVQHAKATELYVDFTENKGKFTLSISNNGMIPGKEIIPSGGLLNVKNRVEYQGGKLNIISEPAFKLTVIFEEGGKTE